DRGLNDLGSLDRVAPKVRRPGGGRRPLTQTDPTVLEDLQRLLEPATVGDPMRPLMWVSKSHAKLAAALRDMGHEVSFAWLFDTHISGRIGSPTDVGIEEPCEARRGPPRHGA